MGCPVSSPPFSGAMPLINLTSYQGSPQLKAPQLVTSQGLTAPTPPTRSQPSHPWPRLWPQRYLSNQPLGSIQLLLSPPFPQKEPPARRQNQEKWLLGRSSSMGTAKTAPSKVSALVLPSAHLSLLGNPLVIGASPSSEK